MEYHLCLAEVCRGVGGDAKIPTDHSTYKWVDWHDDKAEYQGPLPPWQHTNARHFQQCAVPHAVSLTMHDAPCYRRSMRGFL